VPQIYIDDFHVGGYDDLAALDMEGRLDGLLGVVESPATDGAEEV
jgi:glutaredoxin 3